MIELDRDKPIFFCRKKGSIPGRGGGVADSNRVEV